MTTTTFRAPIIVNGAVRGNPELRSKLLALGIEASFIYALLKNTPMTADDVVACLMSEPYEMSYARILQGLNLLLYEGLIKVLIFKSHPTENYKIQTSLTTNPSM